MKGRKSLGYSGGVLGGLWPLEDTARSHVPSRLALPTPLWYHRDYSLSSSIFYPYEEKQLVETPATSQPSSVKENR